MSLNVLLSIIILVSFIVTVVLAVASYTAYKLRERRRPRAILAPEDATMYFERYRPPPATDGAA
ncbi:MAG TPA: hypothetical protein VGA42_09245 [Gemmatimonadales bacterium]